MTTQTAAPEYEGRHRRPVHELSPTLKAHLAEWQARIHREAEYQRLSWEDTK